MSSLVNLEESDPKKWFAVQVDPKLTQPVLAALRQKGFDAFTPFRTVVKTRRDRPAVSLAPLFPGYIFTRLDLQFRLPVLKTPGVRGLVGYGKQPASICEEEIDAVKQVMVSKLAAEPCQFLQTGDTVRLVAGPLAGLTGILISHTKRNRVLIRVTLIQQALAVDVESDWVRPQESITAFDRAPELTPAAELYASPICRAASR